MVAHNLTFAARRHFPGIGRKFEVALFGRMAQNPFLVGFQHRCPDVFAGEKSTEGGTIAAHAQAGRAGAKEFQPHGIEPSVGDISIRVLRTGIVQANGAGMEKPLSPDLRPPVELKCQFGGEPHERIFHCNDS